MKRAVGYCTNSGCEDFAQGVFVLNPPSSFFCARCRGVGQLVRERGWREGSSPDDSFKEVRIKFDYTPIGSEFRQTAVVRDNSLSGEHLIYTLQSPLVKTETRALKMAESILANLNCCRDRLDLTEIPGTSERVLSFDDPFEEFSRKLGLLSKDWEEANSSHRRSRFEKMTQQDGVED